MKSIAPGLELEEMGVRPLNRVTRDFNPARAFTLLELVLVLALLAVLAAMVLPALKGPMENSRLRSAADHLRAQWSKARVRAMDSGQVLVFQAAQGSSAYSVQPWGGVAATTDAFATGNSGSQGGTALPQGVNFAELLTAADSRDSSLAGDGSMTAGSMSNVSFPPIFFYPDGTTSTARVVLSNGQERYLVVELRGLTGIGTVGQVTDKEGAAL